MKTSLFFPVLVASCVTGAGIFTLAQAGTSGARRILASTDNPAESLVDTQWKPAPGQRSTPKVERFELRDNGSGPRLFRNGEEINPGRSAQSPRREPRQEPGSDFRRMLEDQLRRQLGGEPGDSGESDQPESGDSGGLDMEKFMERLMRGMGGPGGMRQDGDAPSRYSKTHRSALAEWRPAVARARDATVRVLTGDNQVALATIVSPDGYALTKASEVKEKDGKLECEFNDGRIVSAKVVDQLDAYDLALLKLDATGLPTVTFSSETPPVGTLVAAVNTDEDPRSTGVISVPARSLNDRQKGYLGIMMGQTSSQKGVAILTVVEGGAAKRAGIQDGDVILSINGLEIDYPAQLQKLITSLTPDEEVTVKFKRGDEEKEVQLSLGSRDEAGFARSLDTTARMGSSLSEKSNGFPNAVQSDLGIDAEDCGGPVVDVNGAVVGLNIARAERVSTYMVPGSALASVLRDVREGKFTLARDPATLKGELREYERAMKQAQEALNAAEERRNSAREALEKLQQQK